MNWIGWTILSIGLGTLLLLIIAPYFVIGLPLSIFTTIVCYFIIVFYLKILGGDTCRLTYFQLLILPFVRLYNLFKITFKTN
jgi:hypothetical protein